MKKMNKYPITYWCGVPTKFLNGPDGKVIKWRFEEMKEAGFTLIDAMRLPSENKQILEYAEELGLEVQVFDYRIADALRDKDKRRELIAKVVEDYKDYPALHSYHIFDEPTSNMFDDLADVVAIFHELDPVRDAYINLLPNYASLEQLGNASYEEHLEEFIAKVKPEIISYDHYHLMKPNTVAMPVIEDERERLIFEAAISKDERAGFFDNYEIVREISMKHGLPYMLIVLVVEHGPYRNLTEGELRWEVFQSLAYGGSRMCYFTYWTPGVDGSDNDEFWHWANGMISKDGEKTEHYHIIKEINKELVTMGTEIMDKKSLGVFHTITAPEHKTKLFQGFGNVEKIEGDPVTVGFFEGGYAVLANRSYEKEASVKLICKAGCALEVLDAVSGEWMALGAEDGCYNITLDAGDGIMVKIAE